MNLLAGPSAGKTTIAHAIQTQLKRKGLRSVFVPEVASFYAGKEDHKSWQNQILVTAEQFDRILTYDGSAQVVVAEGPVLLGLVYPGPCCTPAWAEHVVEMHKYFNNLNLWVDRGDSSAFDTFGRKQKDYAEALSKDAELLEWLMRIEEPLYRVPNDGEDMAIELIEERLDGMA